MSWLLMGVLLIFGGLGAILATFHVANDLWRVVDDMAESLPAEDVSHALDILNEEQS
jgi:hypothetical protein